MQTLAKLIGGMAAIALLAGCANDYNHHDRDRDHHGGPAHDGGDHSGDHRGDHGGDQDHSGPR